MKDSALVLLVIDILIYQTLWILFVISFRSEPIRGLKMQSHKSDYTTDYEILH